MRRTHTGRKPYIRHYGGDGEVIILLHGFLSSKEYWSKIAPKLVAGGYQVIAIDLLGFGSAPKPQDSAYDYEDHIAHLDNVLSDLSIKEPFVLIGHSMGALIAERYALEYRDKVAKLILLHPPLFMGRVEARTLLRSTGRLYRFLLDSRYRNIVWPLLRVLLSGRLRHTKWSRERSMRNVIEKAEAIKDLLRLENATLLLVGLRDRSAYLRNLEAVAVPHAVTILRENVSHHSPVRRPRLVACTILSYLEI